MIIGLTGRKFSGKNTVADMLSGRQVAFADPLREIVHYLFGISFDEMLLPELKEKPLGRYPYENPRTHLQRFGTECIRALYPEAFVNFAERRLRDGQIFTDLRFRNEGSMLRRHNAILFRIDRPSLGPLTDLHQSETELFSIPVDHVIVNDGTIEDLKEKVHDIMGYYQ